MKKSLSGVERYFVQFAPEEASSSGERLLDAEQNWEEMSTKVRDRQRSSRRLNKQRGNSQ